MKERTPRPATKRRDTSLQEGNYWVPASTLPITAYDGIPPFCGGKSGGTFSRMAKNSKKYLRVILLEDGETVHNAFFDRDFRG